MTLSTKSSCPFLCDTFFGISYHQFALVKDSSLILRNQFFLVFWISPSTPFHSRSKIFFTSPLSRNGAQGPPLSSNQVPVAFLGNLFQAQSLTFQIQSNCPSLPPVVTPTYLTPSWASLVSIYMLASGIILFLSSIPAWAIFTFFWASYLNYWHNYLARSPSQICGSSCQHIPLPLLSFQSPTSVNVISLIALYCHHNHAAICYCRSLTHLGY